MKEDFNDALNYEHSRMSAADDIYRSLGYEIIERCSWDDVRGRIFQKADIDIILKKGNKTFNVSEKFRSKPHDDLIVEIYSDWKNKKDGAAIYSQAHQMMYFNGTKEIYCLDTNMLKQKALQWRDELKKLSDSDKLRLIQGKPVRFNDYTVRSFYSHSKYGHWNSLCVIIPWDDLKDCIINRYKI